jgi:hypothetical protein
LKEKGGDSIMKISKSVLLSIVLATMLMTSMLFMGTGSVSNTKLASAGEYDPWKDINDDGMIEMMDYYYLSEVYGTSGTPINKTALLLELQAKIESLNASLLGLEAYLEMRIPILEVSVGELEIEVATLQTTIDTLESRITTLESPGFMNAPAYDSGWLAIGQGQTITLTHNLNTDPAKLFFYVLGNNPTYGVHQFLYGGEWSGTWQGLYASGLNNTQITLIRMTGDPYWPQVRVQIWIIR